MDWNAHVARTTGTATTRARNRITGSPFQKLVRSCFFRLVCAPISDSFGPWTGTRTSQGQLARRQREQEIASRVPPFRSWFDHAFFGSFALRSRIALGHGLERARRKDNWHGDNASKKSHHGFPLSEAGSIMLFSARLRC